MGVINVTPDSFYNNSRQNTIEKAVQKAEQMLQEGATILDIGGQSTQPNSKPITIQEEINRTIPVIENILKKNPEAIISIDTYNAEVANIAVQNGASIINDISAGDMDKNMLSTVAALKVPFIAMHIQGTPQTMQQNPQYENVTNDIFNYFIKKIEQCRLAGINDVIIDVGFGFGKTIQHNMQLLKELHVFPMLHKAILLVVS